MKRTVILFLLFINSYCYCKGQALAKPDSSQFFKIYENKLRNKDIRFFAVNNNQIFHISGNPEDDKFYLLKDSLKIDSVKVYFWKYYFSSEEILSYSGENNTYYQINLESASIEALGNTLYKLFDKYKDQFILGLPEKSKYIGELPHVKKVILSNDFFIRNGTEVDFTTFIGESEGVIGAISLSDKILFTTALCYADGCEEYQQFTYSVDNNLLTKIEISQNIPTANFTKDLKNNGVFFYKDFDYVNLYYLRSDFKTIDTLLYRNIDILGPNIWNTEAVAYMIESKTDEGSNNWSRNLQRVIISSKLELGLEKNLYKIYNNQILHKNDIRNFDLYDLLVLKNMVFAKHNYAFSKTYYQAFFNLYGFYNNDERRKSRTKQVNNKLTDVDWRNLEMINKALENYN